jgi:hypothetical protein
MATQRLRPGPWKLVYSVTSAPITIQIDYEKFEMPPAVSGTRNEVEFEVQQMGLYDDANIIAYRNPVKTVVSVGNTGGNSTEGVGGWWDDDLDLGPPDPPSPVFKGK